MGKQTTSIRQGLPQLSHLDQLTVGGQGGQGLLQPAAPLLELWIEGEALAKALTQHQSSFEGELPATLP